MILLSSNVADSYNKLWGLVVDAWPNLPKILTAVAAVLIAYAIFKWFKDRRNGLQGGNNNHLWGALLFGILLVLPGTILPALLSVVDLLIDFGGKVIQAFT